MKGPVWTFADCSYFYQRYDANKPLNPELAKEREKEELEARGPTSPAAASRPATVAA